MVTKSQKNILVAPLDWGLGHTTRCVPIIRHLRAMGHKVTVAGNDWQLRYLIQTFPGIDALDLEGYNVRYSKQSSGFIPYLFMQLPRLMLTMVREHKWLKRTLKAHHFDGIITDNRYGLYHKHVPGIIMCHQVAPQTGWGGMADGILGILHDKRLSKFNGCWVPDVAGEPSLAGGLSHPKGRDLKLQYIGLLSQMQEQEVSEKHLLVLLSGPEPQRSMLSKILWEQLQGYEGKVVFVEGSDHVTIPDSIPHNISYYKRITSEVLQPLLAAASMVVCRSGYSTLMDLAVLGKKAILIPTPGQAEQEYLAEHLDEAGVYLYAKQKGLDLVQVLKEAETFPYKKLQLDSNAHELYRPVVDEWVKSL